LSLTAEVIRQVAILAQPVMPDACAKLLDLLDIPADQRDFAALSEHPLVAGTKLPPPVPVFPRFVAPEAKEGA
jgi:methionyl-tRNA synthetase